jgi:hypothetical protein
MENTMTSMDNQDESAPLDPALERVRRKMVRLLVISISIMMIGLMAVLFTIVYKVSDMADEGSGGVATTGNAILSQGIIDIPDDSSVVSASLNATRILLHLRGPAGQELLVYDLEDGEVVARVALE